MFLRRKKRIKDGTYKVGILGVRKHKSESGNKGLIIKFDILPDHEEEGLTFESRIPLNTNHPYPLIYKLLNSICAPYETGIDTKDIVHRSCEVDIVTNRDYINIVDIRRLNHKDWGDYYEC